jgi:hypothetical protein
MAKKTGNVLIDTFSSLWLSAAMLFCLFVLTLFGTLYQVDNGLYEAIAKYFDSWFIWVGPFPIFPGALTCMTILTINMIVGGLIRLRWSERTYGIAVTHIGIAMLLGSGMVKMIDADEGNLKLHEGEESNYFTSLFKWEVSVREVGVTRQGWPDHEWILPHESFTDLEGEDSRTFTFSGLPFDLVLSGFLRNCKALPSGPMWDASGREVDGFGLFQLAPIKESEFNVGGLHAEVNGQHALLVGNQRQPWTVQVDGRTFLVDMRHEQYQMPFSIRLQKFMKEDHPGTTMPSAFKSDVLKIDGTGEKLLRIQMNEPLRSGNLVLFQHQFGNQGAGTYSVFSVVDNVSDKWPEISMWVVTAGMLYTFIRALLLMILKLFKRSDLSAGGQA